MTPAEQAHQRIEEHGRAMLEVVEGPPEWRCPACKTLSYTPGVCGCRRGGGWTPFSRILPRCGIDGCTLPEGH